jgi:hypothetical protein
VIRLILAGALVVAGCTAVPTTSEPDPVTANSPVGSWDAQAAPGTEWGGIHVDTYDYNLGTDSFGVLRGSRQESYTVPEIQAAGDEAEENQG